MRSIKVGTTIVALASATLPPVTESFGQEGALLPNSSHRENLPGADMLPKSGSNVEGPQFSGDRRELPERILDPKKLERLLQTLEQEQVNVEDYARELIRAIRQDVVVGYGLSEIAALQGVMGEDAFAKAASTPAPFLRELGLEEAMQQSIHRVRTRAKNAGVEIDQFSEKLEADVKAMVQRILDRQRKEKEVALAFAIGGLPAAALQALNQPQEGATHVPEETKVLPQEGIAVEESHSGSQQLPPPKASWYTGEDVEAIEARIREQGFHPQEIEDLHAVRLVNALLPNGARVETGHLFATLENLGWPIHLSTGIRNTPESQQAAAELIARHAGHPVVYHRNDTDVSFVENLIDQKIALEEALTGPISDSRRSLYMFQAEIVGTVLDMGKTVAVGQSSYASGLEPAIRSMQADLLTLMQGDKPVIWIVHSQGSENHQRALTTVVEELERRVRMRQLDTRHLTDMLGRLHIIPIGAIASHDEWPAGVNLHLGHSPYDADNFGDIVPILGGNRPFGEILHVRPPSEVHSIQSYLPHIVRTIDEIKQQYP